MEENKKEIRDIEEAEHDHGECCHHDHEHEEHEHHHEHEEHDHDECCHHDHEHEEHEHHHDHDECCGHDHHDHDHDGCCDHDHEGHEHHDHGHKYEVPGYKLVETHKHEGATVCSFEKETKMPAADAVAAMEAAMNSLEKWLNENGAVIGHVKGYVKECGLTTTFSTVGGGLNVQSHEGVGASIGFASIVFGPDEETMKDKVIEAFGDLK